MNWGDGQKQGNQRSNDLQKFLGVYEGMINTDIQRTIRKLSIKTFQEHSHLLFSERFFASRRTAWRTCSIGGRGHSSYFSTASWRFPTAAADVFSTKNELLGHRTLSNKTFRRQGQPIKSQYRRILPVRPREDSIQEEERKKKLGVYWTSVVLARKWDRTLWYCIDYRHLNEFLRKDRYLSVGDHSAQWPGREQDYGFHVFVSLVLCQLPCNIVYSSLLRALCSHETKRSFKCPRVSNLQNLIAFALTNW